MNALRYETGSPALRPRSFIGTGSIVRIAIGFPRIAVPHKMHLASFGVNWVNIICLQIVAFGLFLHGFAAFGPLVLSPLHFRHFLLSFRLKCCLVLVIYKIMAQGLPRGIYQYGKAGFAPPTDPKLEGPTM